MDSTSNLRGQMPPPPRRPYKRIPQQEWERQKPHIQALYIGDRGMKLKDILQALKEQHDFDVGERQLKRKLDEWNLTRNIPSRDMKKMVRKRRVRENQFGKPTRFTRRQGDGDFQEISQEQLDKFLMRHGPGVLSADSPSSGLRSGIFCDTPSINDRPSPAVNSNPITEEFNNSVEMIFEDNLEHDEPESVLDSASPSVSTKRTPITTWEDDKKCYTLGRLEVFNGNYRAARDMFDRSRLIGIEQYGPNDWLAVVAEFNVALLKAADFAGSPQNIVARIAQELSSFLIRERQKYLQANPQERDLLELRKILTALKMNSRFYSEVIMQQRALKIWEPILGPEHPTIKKMYDNIALKRITAPVNLDLEPSRIEDVYTPTDLICELDNRPQLAPIADMLHLDDDHPDKLQLNFDALEKSDAASRRMQREIKLLRYGRSQCLLGMYYSFLGRNNEADKAFRDSNRYMEYETNVEMKLHRILWFAEHGTRLQDWSGVRKLLGEAHEVYMKNDAPSEFVITHFPSRFEHLTIAISHEVAIDKVMGWWREDISSINERAISDGASPSIRNDTPLPALTSPHIPGEVLFPPTPGESHFAIDVGTWNRFVTFAPNGDSLPAEP